MAKCIPILDANGFSTDLPIKADEAMSNFYITQRSQSDSFRGQVVSLSHLIQQFGNDPRQLQEQTKRILGAYFERQFDGVDLAVTTEVNGPSIDLQIDAILRDGDDQINLVHAVTYTNSKIKSIIDLQNNGKEIIPADLFG